MASASSRCTPRPTKRHATPHRTARGGPPRPHLPNQLSALSSHTYTHIPPLRGPSLRLQVFAFFKPYLSRAHNMGWTSWFDYMTRIALKSNRECEARLPVLLLRTVLTADSLAVSAKANLVSAARAAGLIEDDEDPQPSGDAQPWYEQHADLLSIIKSVRDGATGGFDADVQSYQRLVSDSAWRTRTKVTVKELTMCIKLFHQIDLAVFFRLHDLQNPRSGARTPRGLHASIFPACGARCLALAAPASITRGAWRPPPPNCVATRPRPTGKSRDERAQGDALDKAAIARVKACLQKLAKIKAVNSVIEMLTGFVLPKEFRVDSPASLLNCTAGAVPWRASRDASAGAASGSADDGAPRARPRALKQAEIRLYLAYHRCGPRAPRPLAGQRHTATLTGSLPCVTFPCSGNPAPPVYATAASVCSSPRGWHLRSSRILTRRCPSGRSSKTVSSSTRALSSLLRSGTRGASRWMKACARSCRRACPARRRPSLIYA